MKDYLLLLSGMAISFVGQILLKKGVGESQLSANLESIIRTVFSPTVFLGFVFYGVAAIVWLFVLQRLPLSVAAPMLSLSYVFIFIYSLMILKEPYTAFNFAGMLIIILGVVLITIK